MGIKFNKLDYGKWTAFRMGTNKHLDPKEFQLLCELHAKYYKHKFSIIDLRKVNINMQKCNSEMG